jgi:hypothetical protein
MNFQIHNLQNGSMKECDLLTLSRSLSVDSEIVLFDGEKVEAIGFVSHSLLVYFCVEFADYALQNYEKKKFPKTEECLFLVRKWIENPNSVSKEELRVAANAAAYAAAYAAYAAAADAADAAYAAAAANAADAAAAADAAYAAADAAYDAAAADADAAYAAAAYAAANAAYAAAAANEFERQGRFILDFFQPL